MFRAKSNSESFQKENKYPLKPTFRKYTRDGGDVILLWPLGGGLYLGDRRMCRRTDVCLFRLSLRAMLEMLW